MKRIAPALILAGGLFLPAIGLAEDAVSPGTFVANNVWMMLCAGLVFIMHLGFATLESGLTRAKNTTNILFQAMFAATAATIVSGAVAERIKLSAFMIFATLFVAVVYTIAGSWKWGGGFLDGMGFHDFAGSTLVHSVGGWGALNGVLAGLVGITAGADTVGVSSAAIIGAVAGALVVGSVMFFDRLKIDDPVGAISVHLTCGVWGTLAVGIFSTNAEHSFGLQLVGVVCYGAFTFASALGIFAVLKLTMGIRVSEEEELEGLDLGEHGMHAYDLGAGSGWQEQSPCLASQSLALAASLESAGTAPRSQVLAPSPEC